MTEQLIQRLEHALKVIIDDKITLSVPPQPTDVDVIIYATIEYLKEQAAQQKDGFVCVPVEKPSLAMQQKLWEIVNEFEQTKEAFPAKWCTDLLRAAQEPT